MRRMSMVVMVMVLSACAAHAQTCWVGSLSDLNTCVTNQASYNAIALYADVSCTGSSCCGPSNAALMVFNNRSNFTLSGSGKHHIYRDASYDYHCAVMEINNGSNFTVQDMVFDEGYSATDCPIVGDPTCHNSIAVTGVSGMTFFGVDINWSHGFALNVHETPNLVLDQVKIVGSALIGLFTDSASGVSGLDVRHSVFLSNNTNAIAAHNQNNGQIHDTLFQWNHHHGMYPCGTGCIYPGGQLFLYGTSNGLTVNRNLILDSFCDNCTGGQSGGIELGDATSVVTNLEMKENVISGNAGAVLSASYTPVASSVSLHNNTFSGNGAIAVGATGWSIYNNVSE